MEKEVFGYIAKPTNINIDESFKGIVVNKEIKFPKKLGLEHPFDFEQMEGLYKKYPFVTGAVDKHVDTIVGDFSVKVEDEKGQALIDSFIKDTNFQVFLRNWVKTGLIDGNSFAEIDLDNAQIRVLDSKTMYIVRDDKGNIKGFNQYTGDLLKLGQGNNKPLPFKLDRIAHLPLNVISDSAYGFGIVYPNSKAIELRIQNQLNQHKLVDRKAGNPYHVKIGLPGQSAKKENIDDFNSKLEYLNTRTEWVTDGNVDIKGIDFGDLGKGFEKTNEMDLDDLIFGFQVPHVLMGVSNVNEGIAKVQLQTFQKRIKSFQQDIEKVLEEKIFRPYLLNNGLDKSVEVIWELPGEEQTNQKIDRLNKVLASSQNISENMRRMAELELAKLLEIEDAENYLLEPDVNLKKAEDETKKAEMDARKEQAENPERAEEEKIKQPEVPTEKPNAKECAELEIKQKNDDLQEKINAQINEQANRTGITDKHWHTISTNKQGNGETTRTIPTKEDVDSHTHKISSFKVQKIDNHSHGLEEKDSSIMCGCGCGQQIHEKENKDITVKEWVNLQEIQGFNYTEYLANIIEVLGKDKFIKLAAKNIQEIELGLLNEKQVERLRVILKEGFLQNKTIKEIETDMNKFLDLKDRFIIRDGEKILHEGAKTRANNITRTETSRLANTGLIKTFKENKIEKVRFLAAVSERTCPQCNQLDSQVFDINKTEGIIPVHSSCRCTWISVIE